MKKIRSLQDYLSKYVFSPCGESSNPLFPDEKRKATDVRSEVIDGVDVPVFFNEFWTSGQRKACSLHEISYRACFKPQLPAFFIRLLTRAGDTVYDPFAGRGTTAIESALLGRRVIANDANPLCEVFTRARFFVPDLEKLESRLERIRIDNAAEADIDLSMFYHPDTEAEIVSLKNYLLDRKEKQTLDKLDRWIAMVSTNRLTGHSSGFFSVYTLPPNQAASPKNQEKINKKRGQTPQYKDTKKRILKKTKSLVRDITPGKKKKLSTAGFKAQILTGDARQTHTIKDESVKLTVTSPPFLDVVQYASDNWLRFWFNGREADAIGKNITMARTAEQWTEVMGAVLEELFRITAPGGWVAFEVGEVKKGKVELDRLIPPLGRNAGFICAGIVVNGQKFTKTSNIWGVKNNKSGTNTNRIVLFYKGNDGYHTENDERRG